MPTLKKIATWAKWCLHWRILTTLNLLDFLERIIWCANQGAYTAFWLLSEHQPVLLSYYLQINEVYCMPLWYISESMWSNFIVGWQCLLSLRKNLPHSKSMKFCGKEKNITLAHTRPSFLKCKPVELTRLKLLLNNI